MVEKALIWTLLIISYTLPAKALPEFTGDYLIILAGSKNAKDTEKKLAEIMKRWPGSVRLSEGYPGIMRSDGKKGLNPGFVIAVAGVCSEEGKALEIQKELRKTIPGVYIRKVARHLPGFIPDCPRLKHAIARKAHPEAPPGYVLRGQGSAGKHGLIWRIYAGDTQCGRSIVVQLVGPDGYLVGERREDAHCVEGEPGVPGSGESKFWSARLATEKGKPRRYVLLTYEQWAADTGCNGGFALCPGKDGILAEALEGMCNSSPYMGRENVEYCPE